MTVIMLLAIVVIGPRDLPKVMQAVGVWAGRARAVARDFRSAMDGMAQDATLQDLQREMEEKGRIDWPDDDLESTPESTIVGQFHGAEKSDPAMPPETPASKP